MSVVGMLSMRGEGEVTDLRLQLTLAGRSVFCGEESTLAALCCVCCEGVSDLLAPASTFCI